MKRSAASFDAVIGWPNLLAAALNARRGKLGRAVVGRFEDRREWELVALQRALEDGSYRPGPFRTHRIQRPKPRLISAAPYPDRVVHHAVMNVLAPVLDRRFRPESYACRAGKGTHAAAARVQALMRQHPYALRADVRQFFPSIDHDILKATFRRLLKDPRLLALLDVIVDGSNPQDEAADYFPGDDLFTPHLRRRGLPIGNLTSQWFANWHLDALDQAVTGRWGFGGYVRYCDDFLVFGPDRGRLEELRCRIDELLAGRRLKLHPRKTAVVPTAPGITFVGYRIWPGRKEVRGANVRLFLRRCRAMRRRVEAGTMTLDEVRVRTAGWLGHAAQADSLPLVARLFKRWPFTEYAKIRANEEKARAPRFAGWGKDKEQNQNTKKAKYQNSKRL